MNKTKRIGFQMILLILFVIIGRIYFGHGTGYKCGRRLKPLTPPREISHDVSSIAPQLELVQKIEGLFLWSMILEENIAFIVGSFDEMENVHLFRFDTAITQEEWENCLSTGVMTVDKTHLYMWKNPGQVVAYDKETGAEMWKVSVDSWYTVIDAIDITPFGLFIEARNQSGTRFHLLNPETGEKTHTFQSSIEWLSFQVEHGSTAYVVTERESIIASGDVQWQIDPHFDYYMSRDPMRLIVKDTSILVYQVSPNYIQLMALGKTDGEIIWKQDVNIQNMYTRSNRPAIMNNTLFLMTDDTELVSIDLITGQMETMVTFIPKIIDLSSQSMSVTLATDDEQILVYFGSSHQLFNFRFSVDE